MSVGSRAGQSSRQTMTEAQWRVTIINANNPDVHWDHPVENSKKKHKGKQMDTSDRNEENSDYQQSSLETRLL
jgi:hypothetical protein